MTDTGELFQPLLEKLGTIDALLREGPKLRGHEEEAVRTLRYGLRTADLRHATFKYLGWTSAEFTAALVDELLRLALRERYTGTVRELLSRLGYHQTRTLVPPAVFELLDAEQIGADPVAYSDWRRMAEILDNLGLRDALAELCRRARDSIDPDIREVAEDFSDD